MADPAATLARLVALNATITAAAPIRCFYLYSLYELAQLIPGPAPVKTTIRGQLDQYCGTVLLTGVDKVPFLTGIGQEGGGAAIEKLMNGYAGDRETALQRIGELR